MFILALVPIAIAREVFTREGRAAAAAAEA